MRDDELRERLRDSNPWWRAAATGTDTLAWAKSDQMLRARAAYDLGYRSRLLDDVADEPVDDKLVVLRGARRVGKSVLLKDTAARLCEREDIDPRQLVYVPTDGMRASDLGRVTKLGRELTRSVGDVRRVWLLDEVTGIRNWTQALKYLRDNTELGSDTVVCTGSSWDREAEVERDLFAGRAGRSTRRRSRILHPMSFRDVLLATGREIPLPAHVPPWSLHDEIARAAVESLDLFVDELDLAWQAYLSSGGFPRAVAEHHGTGEVSEAFVRDLAAWLHRDVDPEAGEDSVPRLLSALEGRCASPLNRRALAHDLRYGSRQTVDLRLARLVRTYAALWCHQVDEDGHSVAGSQSKLYLCDPLLAWLGTRLRAGLPRPDLSRLTEACVGVALARAVDELEPGRWEDGDSIGYLRTGAGKEIDFAPMAVPSPSGTARTVPLESKWVSSGWRAGARVIEGKFAAGVVATRTIFDSSNPAWALPAPVVALLLE
ncbi:MAG: AAA family ATPase [Solirubrobacteraceae bacterium]